MENESPQNQTALRRPVRQVPQEPEQKKVRIKMWMAVAMIAISLLVDLFSLIPLVGSITSAVSYFGFWVWFMLLKVSFTKNPKKLAAVGATAIIEIFFSFLPAFTAGIAATIFMTMAEDKGGILGKVAGAIQMKAKYAGYNNQVSNMERLQPNTLNLNPNKQSATNTNKRPPSQNIKDWENSTKRLNDIQHKQFVEKNYNGGMDKYKQDESKQIADRNQRDEAQKKLKEHTKKYDGLFNGEKPSGPMQIAKE